MRETRIYLATAALELSFTSFSAVQKMPIQMMNQTLRWRQSFWCLCKSWTLVEIIWSRCVSTWKYLEIQILYSECLKIKLVWILDSSVVSHSQTVPFSDTFFCLKLGHKPRSFYILYYDPKFPKRLSLVCPYFQLKSRNLMSEIETLNVSRFQTFTAQWSAKNWMLEIWTHRRSDSRQYLHNLVVWNLN